ncbi:MAG: NAD(P)/FAD-dependent oxidoreductase [Cyanobacteria bacterium J06598_4]
MKDQTKPIVIVGGGFTGLFTALHLRHQKCSRPVILIDRQWRFMFTPLLYELLTNEVKVDLVWPRYDELLAGSDIMFVHDSVAEIDLKQRRVSLDSDLCYDYEYLVLGLGSAAGYFNIPGAKENTFAFRQGEDVFKLGAHLRDCLQRATQETDPEQKQKLLTVSIIGAGPVGVELATTLADLLPIWYEGLKGNPDELEIVMLQRGGEILKGDVNELSRPAAEKSLQQRKAAVKLILNASVTAVGEDWIEYEQEGQTQKLETATAAWTAGTVTHPLIKQLAVSDENRDRQGKLIVTPTHQLPEYPEVFAGGDCVVNPKDPQPALAQVAYQQAKAIATNIEATCVGKEVQPAKISLRGTLMKLGMGESVAEIYDRLEVKGEPAHLIRQAVYLSLLPTPLRNFKVTAEWFSESIYQKLFNSQK